MKRNKGCRFNTCCPVCGRKFTLGFDESVPKHYPIGQISDNLAPCNGSGEKAVSIKPVYSKTFNMPRVNPK